ncbi:minor capsid protein [Cryobacterium sp. Y57]|uniref:minor capsid protein n=1 Tax=Cryobacterium sp. Y57 TaxID=2048287 RepID=UPI001E471ECF|nr:minor capsid protein [Cryobacterium sp. Y57]
MDDVALTKIICGELGAIAGWAWRENGPVYTADEVAVFYGTLGTGPDKAAGVRVYGTTDERFLGWRRVQLRLRGGPGRPDGADALSTPSFAALHGLSRMGGISSISRESMAPAGADDNRREMRTENYLIILDNLEALT